MCICMLFETQFVTVDMYVFRGPAGYFCVDELCQQYITGRG